MMVLLQQGFAVSKKAKFFEIIGTRVFLLGFLKYFRNILSKIGTALGIQTPLNRGFLPTHSGVITRGLPSKSVLCIIFAL